MKIPDTNHLHEHLHFKRQIARKDSIFFYVYLKVERRERGFVVAARNGDCADFAFEARFAAELRTADDRKENLAAATVAIFSVFGT